MTKEQALLIEMGRALYTLLPHHNERLMAAVVEYEAEIVSADHESGVEPIPTVETPPDAA